MDQYFQIVDILGKMIGTAVRQKGISKRRFKMNLTKLFL